MSSTAVLSQWVAFLGPAIKRRCISARVVDCDEIPTHEALESFALHMPDEAARRLKVDVQILRRFVCASDEPVQTAQLIAGGEDAALEWARKQYPKSEPDIHLVDAARIQDVHLRHLPLFEIFARYEPQGLSCPGDDCCSAVSGSARDRFIYVRARERDLQIRRAVWWLVTAQGRARPKDEIRAAFSDQAIFRDHSRLVSRYLKLSMTARKRLIQAALHNGHKLAIPMWIWEPEGLHVVQKALEDDALANDERKGLSALASAYATSSPLIAARAWTNASPRTRELVAICEARMIADALRVAVDWSLRPRKDGASTKVLRLELGKSLRDDFVELSGEEPTSYIDGRYAEFLKSVNSIYGGKLALDQEVRNLHQAALTDRQPRDRQ